MHTTAQLARAVMRRQNLTSAYSLGKLFGASPETALRWLKKQGSFGEENAIKCARLLSLNPTYVLACAAAERSKDKDARGYWKALAKKLQTSPPAAALK